MEHHYGFHSSTLKATSSYEKNRVASHDKLLPLSASVGRRNVNGRYGVRKVLAAGQCDLAMPLHLSAIDRGHPRFTRSVSPASDRPQPLCFNLSSFDCRPAVKHSGKSSDCGSLRVKYDRSSCAFTSSQAVAEERTYVSPKRVSFNQIQQSSNIVKTPAESLEHSSPSAVSYNYPAKSLRSSEFNCSDAKFRMEKCIGMNSNDVKSAPSVAVDGKLPSSAVDRSSRSVDLYGKVDWRSSSAVSCHKRQSVSPDATRSVSGLSAASAGRHRSLSPRCKIVTDVQDTLLEGPEPCDQHLDSKRWQYIFNGPEDSGPDEESRFVAVSRLQDVQAVRCAEFHPDGTCYAIGSNSKTLRICSYPSVSELRKDHTTLQPNVLYKRAKQHKGSIYSLCWSPAGDLLATGSNDKTVKLMRFHADSCSLDETSECELTVHDGTVRDVCFIEDMSNRTSLLASGGAGDCNIWLTDCETATPFQSMTGHTGHVLSLYTWGGAVFVSGSQDRTVRFWDLRSRGCVNVVQAAGGGGSSSSSGGSARGSAVAAVVVDPSGRLLVSGHEDASCWLYDVRGGRHIQRLHCHSADVRSVRFSPSAFYLLTAGYDGRLVLSDMQGDLTAPLQSVCVARHADKAITGRWHPHEFSFVSTSADKTCTLWALPPL